MVALRKQIVEEFERQIPDWIASGHTFDLITEIAVELDCSIEDVIEVAQEHRDKAVADARHLSRH